MYFTIQINNIFLFGKYYACMFVDCIMDYVFCNSINDYLIILYQLHHSNVLHFIIQCSTCSDGVSLLIFDIDLFYICASVCAVKKISKYCIVIEMLKSFYNETY